MAVERGGGPLLQQGPSCVWCMQSGLLRRTKPGRAWCRQRKVARKEVGELGDGRPDVLLFVVEVVVAGAVDPVEFLGAGGVLEGMDAHPGRDGFAAGDHEQGCPRGWRG